MKIVYLILGHLSLLLGIIGAFLPILPTTPFLLLAAFLYSKSSPRLHQYLIHNKYFGKPIRDWEESRVISIKAKILATVIISLVLIFKIPYLKVSLFLRCLVGMILVGVVIFINLQKSRK